MSEPRLSKERIFELLVELHESLNRTSSLNDVLKQVTDAALQILPCEHASVRVLDDSGSELLSGARTGQGAERRVVPFKKGEGVAGWVAEEGQSALVFDTEKDPRFKKGGSFAIRSMLLTPIWSAGHVVGVLGVTSSKPGSFNTQDEAVITMLSNGVAPAIGKIRLERLAVIDHQTRTYNETTMLPRLSEEMERARRHISPLTILSIDLDGFRSLNQKHGHTFGDKVLRAVAEHLQASIRRTDMLIRRKGDDFCILMPHTSSEGAAAAAARFLDGLKKLPIKSDCGPDLFQTLSIGLAAWDGNEDANELIRRADEALLDAKEQGGDRLVMATTAPRAPRTELP